MYEEFDHEGFVRKCKFGCAGLLLLIVGGGYGYMHYYANKAPDEITLLAREIREYAGPEQLQRCRELSAKEWSDAERQRLRGIYADAIERCFRDACSRADAAAADSILAEMETAFPDEEFTRLARQNIGKYREGFFRDAVNQGRWDKAEALAKSALDNPKEDFLPRPHPFFTLLRHQWQERVAKDAAAAEVLFPPLQAHPRLKDNPELKREFFDLQLALVGAELRHERWDAAKRRLQPVLDAKHDFDPRFIGRLDQDRSSDGFEFQRWLDEQLRREGAAADAAAEQLHSLLAALLSSRGDSAQQKSFFSPFLDRLRSRRWRAAAARGDFAAAHAILDDKTLKPEWQCRSETDRARVELLFQENAKTRSAAPLITLLTRHRSIADEFELQRAVDRQWNPTQLHEAALAADQAGRSLEALALYRQVQRVAFSLKMKPESFSLRIEALWLPALRQQAEQALRFVDFDSLQEVENDYARLMRQEHHLKDQPRRQQISAELAKIQLRWARLYVVNEMYVDAERTRDRAKAGGLAETEIAAFNRELEDARAASLLKIASQELDRREQGNLHLAFFNLRQVLRLHKESPSYPLARKALENAIRGGVSQFSRARPGAKGEYQEGVMRHFHHSSQLLGFHIAELAPLPKTDPYRQELKDSLEKAVAFAKGSDLLQLSLYDLLADALPDDPGAAAAREKALELGSRVLAGIPLSPSEKDNSKLPSLIDKCSTIAIENRTAYALILYFQGPERFLVRLDPYRRGCVALKDGHYEHAAFSAAEDVTPYHGKEDFLKRHKQSFYVIKSSSSFSQDEAALEGRLVGDFILLRAPRELPSPLVDADSGLVLPGK
ncbi:MAG: hypothetical protein RL095_200 [Verrucomicrobiota bacterium]|jgi:hypothetical protein